MLLVLASKLSFGQELIKPTKYFLNNKEIAPQSFFFIDAEDIDSIKVVEGLEPKFILFAKNTEDYLSFKELLDYHYLEPEAIDFPFSFSSTDIIDDKNKLVFCKKNVAGIRVSYYQGVHSLHIQDRYHHTDIRSKKGKSINNVRLKFNKFKKDQL